MFDYETLKLVWWVLIGVLLIGFALTDGFDMGAMALMPFVGKTDNERRVAINTIAPHWDGNQVWFITAGGALFAAWPMVYAVAFSGLYWAMLLVLFALFCRPVGFDYRSKLENTRWRSAWDWALFVGGAVPALVFGVAFGNLFLGLPFQLDDMMRSSYHGSFFALLNPFALLCGVVSLSMLCAHGGAWLMMRTEGDLAARSRTATYLCAGIPDRFPAGRQLAGTGYQGHESGGCVRCWRGTEPAAQAGARRQCRLARQLQSLPTDNGRPRAWCGRRTAGDSRQHLASRRPDLHRQ